jgi:hypothetical protein
VKHFLFIALLVSCLHPADAQKTFSFYAIGDMPYHNPADIEKFRKLTAEINARKPAFTVHVGDIKNGSTECSDDYFRMMVGLFNAFRSPLIYTPGDNEWTDCGRPKAGGYDPIERLATLRKIFFRNNQSFGKKPLTFSSQHAREGYEDFVENVMWRKQGITFGTLHVVGSNNDFKGSPQLDAEFLKRDKANLAWIAEIFNTARAHNDAGIVLVMHAAMIYNSNEDNGFTSIVEKLRTETEKFRKPVLLLYGDHHRFAVSKPLTDSQGSLISNFTALMVFGDRDMHAVRIDVNARSREVFSFSELVMEY